MLNLTLFGFSYHDTKLFFKTQPIDLSAFWSFRADLKKKKI